MTKKGLRNSDGWTWPTPNSIQRRAPLCSGPDDRHEDQQDEEEGGAEQRAAAAPVPCGIIEMPIITGMPSAIQASWRQK